jgi:hypothetical protein
MLSRFAIAQIAMRACRALLPRTRVRCGPSRSPQAAASDAYPRAAQLRAKDASCEAVYHGCLFFEPLTDAPICDAEQIPPI